MSDNIIINTTTENINLSVSTTTDVYSLSVINVDGASRWGLIVGTLSAQTDLWSALSGGNLSTDIQALSNDVIAIETFLNLLSGTWNGGFDAFTAVSTNSANWDYAYNTVIGGLSSDLWNQTYTTVVRNSANWDKAYTWVETNSANATFQTVSAISLSGIFYGDGSNLIGASLPGQAGINTTVQTGSANWNNAYNTAVAYQEVSASFATIEFTDSKYLPLSGGVITNDLYVDGNVGIGTTTPSEKLQVDGKGLFQGIQTNGTIAYNNIDGSILNQAYLGNIVGSNSIWNGNGFAFTNSTGGDTVGGMFYNSNYMFFGDVNTPINWAGISNDGAYDSYQSGYIGTGTLNANTVIHVGTCIDDGSGAKVQTSDNGNSIQWNNAYTNIVENSAAYIATPVYGTEEQIIATPGANNSVTLSLPNSIVTPGDLNITGSLFVNGTAANINSINISLSDSLIYLGEGNISNVVDIGFVGNYTPAPSAYQHTGLVRVARDNKWTLFSGITAEPTTVVDFSGSYVIDTLRANIEGTLFGNVSGNVTGNAGSVTNGVYTNGSYSNPSWIVDLADTKITGNKFATSTLLQTTSALLTPLTLTNTLTSQLVHNTAINSLTGNWNSAYASTTALNLSSSIWNSTYTTLCANSATWVKFQPNPEYLADNISDAWYNNNRYIRQDSTYYNVPDTYPNTLWIQKYGGESVWKIGYTSSGGDTSDDYTLVTSQNNATYPWQATWPNGTLVTKASAVRVIGQPLAAIGTEGTSQWAARADHKHPYPTYSQVGAAAASHTHPISQVVDLQSNLDSKATLNPSIFIDNQVEEIGVVNSGGYDGEGLLYKTTDPYVNYYYNTTPYQLLGEACFKRDFFYGYITGGSSAAIAIGWDGVKWIIRSTNTYFNANATSSSDWPWYCTFDNSSLAVFNNYQYSRNIGPSVSPTLTIGEAYNSGNSDKAARADHQHPLPYQAPDNDHQNIFITVPSFTYYNGYDTVSLNAQQFNIVYSGYWPVRLNRKVQYNYSFQYYPGAEDPDILVNFNLSWTISNGVSAWKILYTTDNQMGYSTSMVVASSLSDTTYPWDAVWTPTNTIITRYYNVTPLAPTLSGSSGISPYISRADHTHPSELYYTVVNSNFNIISNRKYIVDTTVSQLIGTLPATPVVGDNITFIDSNNTWASRPLIINNNGNLLQTYNESLTADINGYQFQLVYIGGSYGWKIV